MVLFLGWFVIVLSKLTTGRKPFGSFHKWGVTPKLMVHKEKSREHMNMNDLGVPPLMENATADIDSLG